MAVVCVAVVWSERDFDPDRHCGPGETGNWMSVDTGMVESSSRDRAAVSYDDGRRAVMVEIDGNVAPAAG